MNSSYNEDEAHSIRNTLSQLGLADVKAFGLEWKDCEAIMQNLGFKLEVKALVIT
jgi:predicted nucleotide-binding protein (sugar kinase/HSP70/actin superfamily)